MALALRLLHTDTAAAAPLLQLGLGVEAPPGPTPRALRPLQCRGLRSSPVRGHMGGAAGCANCVHATALSRALPPGPGRCVRGMLVPLTTVVLVAKQALLPLVGQSVVSVSAAMPCRVWPGTLDAGGGDAQPEQCSASRCLLFLHDDCVWLEGERQAGGLAGGRVCTARGLQTPSSCMLWLPAKVLCAHLAMHGARWNGMSRSERTCPGADVSAFMTLGFGWSWGVGTCRSGRWLWHRSDHSSRRHSRQ